MDRRLMLIGTGTALLALAWLVYRRGLSAINPASDDNIVYAGVNAAGEALTGAQDWNLGAAIYDMTTPRGIRNNNPGNIVNNPLNKWQGQTATDGRFAVFSDAHFGLRALARLLLNYMKAGHNTPEKIITRFAPATENDTGSYVRSVSAALGVSAQTPVTVQHLPALIAAIVKHENGQQPYSQAQIATAIRSAA